MQFIKGFLGTQEAGNAPKQNQARVPLPQQQVVRKKENAMPIVANKGPTKKLLVIEIKKDKRDFAKYFKDFTVHGEEIEVHQVGWGDIDVTSYFTTESKAQNPVTAYVSYQQGDRNITVKPDFILVRNEVKEPEPHRVNIVNIKIVLFIYLQSAIEFSKLVVRLDVCKHPSNQYFTFPLLFFGTPSSCKLL